MARAVRAGTTARVTRTGRPRSVRPLSRPPLSRPPRRRLAVPRTRLARSARACLPGTGTVLGCFRAIRVPVGTGAPGMRISAWVGLPARTVATTSIGSELTRSELPRTGLSYSELLRAGLSRSERSRSERSRSGWSRSELLPAGRARSIVARPVLPRPVVVRLILVRPVVVRLVLAWAVLAWAGVARILFLVRPAPTVPHSVGAVSLPLPPRARSVPRAVPSGPGAGLARRPAAGVRPVGRGAVEPVRARSTRGSSAAAWGNRRSVRDKSVFCHGGTAAIPALRPGAAARGARPRAAGAGRGVLRALPRAGKGALVARRLPGGSRREPSTRRHGTFRACARGADRHVPRARTAASVAAVPRIDRVGVRVQVHPVRVALAADVGGVRGTATHPPAGCAVPTIHPVPPGHLPARARRGRPLRMRSPACPASGAGIRHSPPPSSVGRRGRADGRDD